MVLMSSEWALQGWKTLPRAASAWTWRMRSSCGSARHQCSTAYSLEREDPSTRLPATTSPTSRSGLSRRNRATRRIDSQRDWRCCPGSTPTAISRAGPSTASHPSTCHTFINSRVMIFAGTSNVQKCSAIHKKKVSRVVVAEVKASHGSDFMDHYGLFELVRKVHPPPSVVRVPAHQALSQTCQNINCHEVGLAGHPLTKPHQYA
ncbi:hypothetical protein BC828DRAFT_9722 [Blastocladiella britannica]|nr:hypothetical protein BC828DRAFT_9722 [Blastocladiella britannica]